MYSFDGSHGHVERDPRNDPRRTNTEDEVVVERRPIVADRSRNENEWPVVPVDRRRSERRRIERMGTDI